MRGISNVRIYVLHSIQALLSRVQSHLLNVSYTVRDSVLLPKEVGGNEWETAAEPIPELVC